MFWWIALTVFVVVLRNSGRIGPFVWLGRPGHGPVRVGGRPGCRRPAAAAGPAPDSDAERILARRLADGHVTPEEYLERLSLLQEN